MHIILVVSDEQIIDRPKRWASSIEGPVTDSRQFEALVDPTRWAIYTAVGFGGARTIREVAEWLNRRPSTLYRHFDTLEAAGLLEVVGEIETERRPARIYVAPRNPRLLYMPDNDASVAALCRIVVSAARYAGRNTSRSFDSRKARARGEDRDTHITQHGGWLTKDEQKEFNRKVDDLVDFLRNKERREGTTLQHLSAFIWPGGRSDADDDSKTR